MSKYKKKEGEERQKKVYAAAGSRSQKMMSFRVDLENIEWLERQANKGRYLNELIAQDMKRGGA